jgi:hypothetical protein
MNLEHAVAQFEAAFSKVIDGEPHACAPDGQRYTVIASGGIKPEGEPFPAEYATGAEAVAAWLEAAWAFARKAGPPAERTLCWRRRPELEKRNSRAPKPWVVYSRFAIMDKLPEAEAA